MRHLEQIGVEVLVFLDTIDLAPVDDDGEELGAVGRHAAVRVHRPEADQLLDLGLLQAELLLQLAMDGAEHLLDAELVHLRETAYAVEGLGADREGVSAKAHDVRDAVLLVPNED